MSQYAQKIAHLLWTLVQILFYFFRSKHIHTYCIIIFTRRKSTNICFNFLYHTIEHKRLTFYLLLINEKNKKTCEKIELGTRKPIENWKDKQQAKRKKSSPKHLRKVFCVSRILRLISKTTTTTTASFTSAIITTTTKSIRLSFQLTGAANHTHTHTKNLCWISQSLREIQIILNSRKKDFAKKI